MPKDEAVTTECNECETRQDQKKVVARLNKMTGANTVRNWLLGVVVLGVLGGGLFNTSLADSVSDLATRIALTEQSVEELKKMAEEEREHREKHQAQHEEDQEQMMAKQDEILRAVRAR